MPGFAVPRNPQPSFTNLCVLFSSCFVSTYTCHTTVHWNSSSSQDALPRKTGWIIPPTPRPIPIPQLTLCLCAGGSPLWRALHQHTAAGALLLRAGPGAGLAGANTDQQVCMHTCVSKANPIALVCVTHTHRLDMSWTSWSSKCWEMQAGRLPTWMRAACSPCRFVAAAD